MNSTLLRRLKFLETRLAAVVSPVLFRYGWVRRLPKDLVGERHVATVKETACSPNLFWCEFEERPGPAPVGVDQSFTVVLKD